MEDLRFDEDFVHDDLDIRILDEYTSGFKNKALEKRVRLLKNTYGL